MGEGGKLISDTDYICDRYIIGGYLVTIEFEKAFDSLDHKFILAVKKKISFGKNSISWVEILLNNQESCVINGGNTARYFHLQRGACQTDRILAYVLILCLEILFILIKNDSNILNPIQDERRPKSYPPNHFFPCNFCKRSI